MSTAHVNTIFIFKEKYLLPSPLKLELTEKCVIQLMEDWHCKRKHKNITLHFF